MRFVQMHSLSTPRLNLRKVRMSDLQNYHLRLTSDPRVAEYMLWNANGDLSHTQATIQRILDGYEAGTRYHWGIARKEDDSLIGTIALLGFDETENSCTFAYMLGQDFWGQGYGSEALHAVLKFAFEEMSVSLVSADHFEENRASGAAMEKAGMRKIAIHPRRYEKNGSFCNAIAYQMKKEDWFSQQL